MAAAGLQRWPGAEDERLKRGLSLIVRSSERAIRMIGDLLDFTQARLGGGIPIERGPVNLRLVAEGAVGETRAAYPDRAVHLEASGDIMGRWDGDRIAQVLTNLLANAVKYSPAESSVQVRVTDEGEGVLLEVKNQGEPIPGDLMPMLFEPYQRGTNRADMGTRSIGLGLFIVEQIVKGHGGRIEVRSTKAEGTTFRVILPRTPGPESMR
jgi:signal transduction histidine kinase